MGREEGRVRQEGIVGAGLFTDWMFFIECAQTHRHTKVKTVYPPVSLRSLGGYNDAESCLQYHHSDQSYFCIKCTNSYLNHTIIIVSTHILPYVVFCPIAIA